MNKYTVISSNIMSIALFLASLPVAAAHHHQQDSLPQEAASNSSAPQNIYAHNYYVFNQYNMIQPVPPPSSLNEQQLGLPYEPAQVSDKGSPYKQSIQPYISHMRIPLARNDAGKPTRYKCPVENCTNSYSRPSDLKNHIRAKHVPYAEANKLFEGGKYPCSVKDCPARFTRMKGLEIHEKKEHKYLNLHFHHTDATNADSNDVEQGCEAPVPQGDEDVHGPQEQAQPQPSNKFSLSFICGE